MYLNWLYQYAYVSAVHAHLINICIVNVDFELHSDLKSVDSGWIRSRQSK